RDAAEFIGAAIESALGQTFADLEVIVIDDHSTDGSGEIAAAIADPRVRVIRGAASGVPASRNFGIEHSRGRYIAFLDADDVWLPENLQRQLSALENNAAIDLTFAAAQWIDDAGRPLGRSTVRWNGPVSYEDLLLEFLPVTFSSVIVRADCVEKLGGFDTSLKVGTDHEFCLRAALLRRNNVMGIPETLLRYRRRTGQVTANARLRAEQWRKLLDKHEQLAPVAVNRMRARATASFQRAIAAIAYDAGEYADARRMFADALRLAPAAMARDPRSWWTAAAMLCSWLPAGVRVPLEHAGRSIVGGR
ncbi:MAG TPA: glycosyltransferase, partial [Blastocatellia bacterium]|nr:glycosyltransferase [Blastocatellia bacterium]